MDADWVRILPSGSLSAFICVHRRLRSSRKTMAERRLRVGVAGLGRAFTIMLPTLARHPLVELVGAADPRPEARQRFAADFGAKTCASIEELCDDPAVEVVYVATPHQYHAQHACLAAAKLSKCTAPRDQCPVMSRTASIIGRGPQQ